MIKFQKANKNINLLGISNYNGCCHNILNIQMYFNIK